jgi:hypothetical protein
MFNKTTENEYIISVGVNIAGEEINEVEYNSILDAIRNRPAAPSGYTYKLRAGNLEWELVELPPMPDPEDEPTVEDKAEAYDILIGGTP